MFGTNGVPPVSAAQILGGVNASIPPVQVTPYQQPVQTQAPQENSEYMDRMMFEQQNPLMMPNMGQ